MLKLIALKSIYPNIKKEKQYYIGGMIQNSNAVVLMDTNKKRIPGNYPCEIFGYTREQLLKKIIGN
jgi:hypothetical protein